MKSKSKTLKKFLKERPRETTQKDYELVIDAQFNRDLPSADPDYKVSIHEVNWPYPVDGTVKNYRSFQRALGKLKEYAQAVPSPLKIVSDNLLCSEERGVRNMERTLMGLALIPPIKRGHCGSRFDYCGACQRAFG